MAKTVIHFGDKVGKEMTRNMKQTLLHTSSCINSNSITPKYEKAYIKITSLKNHETKLPFCQKTVDEIVYLCAFDDQ